MMKVLIFTIVACLLVSSLAAVADSPCKKNCPKNFQPISALNKEQECQVYSNACELKRDVECHSKEFEKCFQGTKCDDLARVTSCA